MLLKCPLKSLSIKRTFQWHVFVASKTSQLLVSYINTALHCLLNCFPITIIGKLLSGTFLVRGYPTGIIPVIASISFLCISSMVLSHAHCNWHNQSWLKQPSCFFSERLMTPQSAITSELLESTRLCMQVLKCWQSSIATVKMKPCQSASFWVNW